MHRQSVTECFPPYFDFSINKTQENNGLKENHSSTPSLIHSKGRDLCSPLENDNNNKMNNCSEKLSTGIETTDKEKRRNSDGKMISEVRKEIRNRKNTRKMSNDDNSNCQMKTTEDIFMTKTTLVSHKEFKIDINRSRTFR